MQCKSVSKSTKTTIINGVKTITTTITTKEGDNTSIEETIETIEGGDSGQIDQGKNMGGFGMGNSGQIDQGMNMGGFGQPQGMNMGGFGTQPQGMNMGGFGNHNSTQPQQIHSPPQDVDAPAFNNSEYLVVSKQQYEKAKEVATKEGKGIIFVCGRSKCGLCNFMGPLVAESVEKNASKLLMVKILIDECNQVSWEDMSKDGGSGMLPFIKAYANGQLTGTLNGADEEGLSNLVKKTVDMV